MSKSVTDLLTEINASIKTNGTRSITGAQLQVILQDIVNSYPNLITSIGLIGLNEYSTTTNYIVGNCCTRTGRIMQCTSPTAGTFDATKWVMVDNGEVVKRVIVRDTVTVANTVTPTLLFELFYTNLTGLPKSTEARFTGIVNSADGATLTIDIHINGSSLFTCVMPGAPVANKIVEFRSMITDRAVGGVPPQGTIGAGTFESETWKSKGRSAAQINTTVGAAIHLEVFATWSGANAGNVFICEQGFISETNYSTNPS